MAPFGSKTPAPGKPIAIASPSAFQIHWSLVAPGDAADLAPPGQRLLALWPAPVNHDACFEAAGFTLFADSDDRWDRAAEHVLQLVIGQLCLLGDARLLSTPLRNDPPWYLRAFRHGHTLPLLEQALLPMQTDTLPPFHAQFGGNAASLRTGDGHFLLWIALPDGGPAPADFVRRVAEPWEIVETQLRWAKLLPCARHAHPARR